MTPRSGVSGKRGRWLWAWQCGAFSAALLAGCHSAGAPVEPVLEALSAGLLDPEPPVPPQPTPAAAALPPGQKLTERLDVPLELPGAAAPRIQLPPSSAPPQERTAAINRLYDLRPAPVDKVQAVLGPEGRPLALSDLQRLAVTRHPAVRQAAAEVEAARGAAVQAGLPPNPIVGYEGDTINQGATAGIQGAYLEQTIKTAGKLELARAAAALDVVRAELALRQVRNEVMTQVRAQYFAVLVARERVRVYRALVRFTEEAYRIQVERVRGDQAAPYEPLPLRAQAMQARAGLVQAQNHWAAAWKQLAATVGQPDLPVTELAGRSDMPAPHYRYDEILTRILDRHTDVLSARNAVEQARYHLRLAQLTPVPDVDLRVMVQKDFTTPPFRAVTSVQVGVPVPAWDRNQGNIRRAEAELQRTQEQERRVIIDLTTRLAEAFQRYESGRVLLQYYKDHILPDLVRSFRGVKDRHDKEPDVVNFVDVATAQLDLNNAINSYLQILAEFWTAVVDVAALLQTTDLFQLGGELFPCPGPELDAILGPPRD